MNMKRILSMLMVLVTLVSLMSMAVYAAPQDTTIEVVEEEDIGSSGTAATTGAVKLNKTKVSIVAGETFKLKLNTSKKCKWSTSNKSIATVSSNGTVKAKKVGTCTITCKVGSKKLKCKVTVKAPATVSVASRSILGITVKVANKTKARTITKMTLKAYVYNSDGSLQKFVNKTTGKVYDYWPLTLEGTIFAKGSATTPILYYPDDTYNVAKVKLVMTSVTFSNGTTWKA